MKLRAKPLARYTVLCQARGLYARRHRTYNSQRLERHTSPVVAYKRVEQTPDIIHVTQRTRRAEVLLTLFAMRSVAASMGKAMCPAAIWKKRNTARSVDAFAPSSSSVTPARLVRTSIRQIAGGQSTHALRETLPSILSRARGANPAGGTESREMLRLTSASSCFEHKGPNKRVQTCGFHKMDPMTSGTAREV